jgi:hypothetical protein
MKQKKTSEVRFKFMDGDHEIEGIVVNPGGWFGKVYIIQIAIANALNPFYAVEAEHEQAAIDEFADSRLSHLIDVEEADQPKFVPADPDEPDDGDYEDNDFAQAGNDGHWVDLTNVAINKAPESIKYYVEWSPEQDDLSAVIDQEFDTVREEN